jgi:hypothetical protein
MDQSGRKYSGCLLWICKRWTSGLDAAKPFTKKMLNIDYINFSYAVRGIKVVANVREELDLNSTPLKKLTYKGMSHALLKRR